MKRLLTLLVTSILLLSGCATGTGPKQEAGMVIGGVLGGLLGSQVDEDDPDFRRIAIIAGTLMGSAIGSSIGQSMDDTDRLLAGQTLETVRTGVSSRWRNPDSGVEYSVTPTRTYSRGEQPCREFTLMALIGGRDEEVYGTACRQGDGSWKIVG